MSTLVQARHLSLSFQQRKVLQDVSLRVRRGEIVTLIGPNGAGKSTLVRVILGLLAPDQGEVHWPEKVRVGYMPQRLSIDHVLPLTVARFLRLGGQHSVPQMLTTLNEVGAERVYHAALQTLSGGELQRVLLARALLRQPDLLVLDEPIQGVDITGQYELYELISKIRTQRQCGVLMVSHDLHLVMAATDHVVCLNQHVCCEGSPDTISQHPAYKRLFDSRAAQDLAVYSHHHQCSEHPLPPDSPNTEEVSRHG